MCGQWTLSFDAPSLANPCEYPRKLYIASKYTVSHKKCAVHFSGVSKHRRSEILMSEKLRAL